MCTLIVALGQFPDFPLVVAANRDERLDRASSPPKAWTGPIPFVAPRDEVAGGTWLGFNAAGLFVGITNRFGVPVDPSRRSRGKLVVEALGHPSARELHRWLGDLRSDVYNPFHLLYADRRRAFVTWSDGRTVRQTALGAGVHIVTERSLGGDDKTRTERVRAEWPKVAFGPAPSPQKIEALLQQHGPEPASGPCVHVPELRYGTRSSFVLLAGRASASVQMFWAEGAPCTAPYADQQGLVASLLETRH